MLSKCRNRVWFSVNVSMVTEITAYIYRPSISKELKALYRHIIFIYGAGGGGEREKGRGREEEGERVGEREGEREQERKEEGQKDMMCYLCTFHRWHRVWKSVTQGGTVSQ